MRHVRLYIIQYNRLEGSGGDAQATVVTAFNINVRRLIEIHAYQGAHLTDVSRETASAGAAAFGSDLDADLASHRSLALKHQHLIGSHCPFAQQIHIPGLHPFHKSLRPEPAGLLAGPSGCDFPALGQ